MNPGDTVEVDVEAVHVRHGKRYKIFYCPLALALSDKFDVMCSVFIHTRMVLVPGYPGVDLFYGDKEAEFVHAFDNGRDVGPLPFTARLEVRKVRK